MQNVDRVVAAVFKRHYAATHVNASKFHGVDSKAGKVPPKDVLGTVEYRDVMARLDLHAKRIRLRTKATKAVAEEVEELEEIVQAMGKLLTATRAELEASKKLYTGEVERLNGAVVSLGEQLEKLQTKVDEGVPGFAEYRQNV
jgi:predicted  nucleic acid-binding Zn-ribbon protein